MKGFSNDVLRGGVLRERGHGLEPRVTFSICFLLVVLKWAFTFKFLVRKVQLKHVSCHSLWSPGAVLLLHILVIPPEVMALKCSSRASGDEVPQQYPAWPFSCFFSFTGMTDALLMSWESICSRKSLGITTSQPYLVTWPHLIAE